MKHVIAISVLHVLTVLLGSALAEPSLSMTLSSDEVSTAEEVQILASIEWEAPNLLTDVYLAVTDDTGLLRFFYPGCRSPQTCPTPFMGSLSLPEGYAVRDYPLASLRAEMLAFSSLPRTYFMVLGLTRRGYLDMVCSPAFAELRITDVQPRTWRDGGPNYIKLEWIDHRWHLTEVNLEINHTWSVFSNQQTSSGSDIDYFYRRGLWPLSEGGSDDFSWHRGTSGSSLGLWVYVSVYVNHASVSAYGYDRQTLPGGARTDNWSLYTTLRP